MKINHIIVELKNTPNETVEIVKLLQKKTVVQMVSDGDFMVIGRFNVNKTTLRRLLKDHQRCLKP